MKVYVETNFVLELAFQQEQCSSCESIITLCENKKIQLIIPAYSLVEPYEKLYRNEKHREKLQQDINNEFKQLKRSTAYSERLQNIGNIEQLLIQSNEEERNRFESYKNNLLNISEIIPLTSRILQQIPNDKQQYNLSDQDATVYSSIIDHLSESQPSKACFLNRNSVDFGNRDIIEALERLNCKILFSFVQGYNYISSQI